MKLFKNFLYCSFVFLLGCKSDKEICDHYYISSSTLGSTTTQFFYNDQGLLKTMVSKVGGISGRTEFYYDGTTLTSAKSYFTYHFYFDSNHLLKATSIYDDVTLVDSLTFEYNQIGQRLTLKKYKASDNFVSYQQELSYPDEKHVVVDFYEPNSATPNNGYTGSFKYTLDDKKVPYPESYYYLSLSATNIILPHNEVTLETYGGPGTGGDHHQYTYNAGSYPTSDGYTSYSYTCAPTME